jgi:hypothetical protein
MKWEKSLYSALLGLLLEACQAASTRNKKIMWPDTKRITIWNDLKDFTE